VEKPRGIADVLDSRRIDLTLLRCLGEVPNAVSALVSIPARTNASMSSPSENGNRHAVGGVKRIHHVERTRASSVSIPRSWNGYERWRGARRLLRPARRGDNQSQAQSGRTASDAKPSSRNACALM